MGCQGLWGLCPEGKAAAKPAASVVVLWYLHRSCSSNLSVSAFAERAPSNCLPRAAPPQMFCRLLGASGPNLRRLYLPGLEGLKAELRRFEFLMARYLPNLKAHLEVGRA